MITVKLHCGQCDATKEITFDNEDDLNYLGAFDLIRETAKRSEGNTAAIPWVVQDNGTGVLDTYCSKRCAK